MHSQIKPLVWESSRGRSPKKLLESKGYIGLFISSREKQQNNLFKIDCLLIDKTKKNYLVFWLSAQWLESQTSWLINIVKIVFKTDSFYSFLWVQSPLLLPRYHLIFILPSEVVYLVIVLWCLDHWTSQLAMVYWALSGQHSLVNQHRIHPIYAATLLTIQDLNPS